MRRIRDEYFDWICDLVCGNRFSRDISYKKLLTRLHETPFTYILAMDSNRAEDGIDLRYRFSQVRGYQEDMSVYLTGPCSVLEMMVALSIRCEEFMDETDKGDRTSQWFWNMLINLGLSNMMDDRFDIRHVDFVVARLLNREYGPDGSGGLFTIGNCEYDLRDVEIWYQLCWYLDNIT